MNRGQAKQRIFFARSDGEYSESLLADGHEKLGVEIHAYCLMTNHFHLLLHCPDGGLSEYMRLLGSAYTRYQNRRLERDGPLFRGRFHSLSVDTDAYVQTAGRYIHRNPLDLGPQVDLAGYRWSSLRNYCAGVPAPAWLQLSLADDHAGSHNYLRYVESTEIGGEGGPVDWAIAAAIAERDSDELRLRPRVDRTVALLMTRRAQQRCRQEVELREVADRALRLAGASEVGTPRACPQRA